MLETALTLLHELLHREASEQEKRLFFTLLSSNFPVPPLDDWNTVAGIKLAVLGNPVESRRVDSCLKELSENKALKNLHSTLYVLRLLANQSKAFVLATPHNLVAQDNTQPGTAHSKSSMDEKSHKARRKDKQKAKKSIRSILFRDSDTTSEESDTEITVIENYAIEHGQKDTRSRPVSSEDSSKLIKDTILEHTIVRDLIYAMQGLPGQYFELIKDPTSGISHFALQRQYQSLSVSQTAATFCERVASCGFFYVRCTELLNVVSKANMGKTRASLCEALHTGLSEYRQRISLLDSQLNEEQMTLVELTAVANLIREEISTLAVIADNCLYNKNLTSLQILNILFGYSLHGDRKIQHIGQSLLIKASEPFFDYLKHWIIEGSLLSTEYFIQPTTSNSTDILILQTNNVLISRSIFINSNWYNKFHISSASDLRTSPLLSPYVTKLCFEIGRASAFLREDCNNVTWRFPESIVAVIRAANFAKLLSSYSSDASEGMIKLIRSVHMLSSKAVVTIVKRQFLLFDHLNGILYILLGMQGDFIPSLCSILSSTSGGDKYKLSMLEKIEQAIMSCNASNLPSHVLGCVDVRVDNSKSNFYVTYSVKDPLTSIITHGQIRIYETIFQIQWRLRSADDKLDQIILLTNFFYRRNTQQILTNAGRVGIFRLHYGTLVEEVPVTYTRYVARLSCIRNRTKQFMLALLNYISHDCIAPEYVSLFANLETAETIKDIIYYHDIAVRTICYKMLISINYHKMADPRAGTGDALPPAPRGSSSSQPRQLRSCEIYNGQVMFTDKAISVFSDFHNSLVKICAQVALLHGSVAELFNFQNIFTQDFNIKLQEATSFLDAYVLSFNTELNTMIACLRRCRDIPIPILDEFDYSHYENLEASLLAVGAHPETHSSHKH
ncbi:Gamma tubulin ring complex [Giardia duodenalis ATCC 50581]|uniref:Gamma tubulin ring complex n=2 Tax=Giardia intestinalis TaxID=5741 RepID=C6LV14_GIAIB|nr:Gamma tubulin ring complex [Giardia intestinalis ATCC 50581]